MAIITVHSSLTVLSVACSIVIIAFAVVQGAGYAPTSHVILMAVGVLGCFSQGVLSYVANYGGVALEDRRSRRSVHGTVMLVGMLAVIVGYLAVYAKLKGGPFDPKNHPPTSLRVHSAMGYGVMGLLVIQVVAGIMKLRRIERDGRRMLGWHGVLGPLVYLLCLLTIMFGFNGLYSTKHTAFSVCVTVGLIAVFLLAVVALFCGPRRKRSTGVAMPETVAARSTSGPGPADSLLHGTL